MKTHDPQFPSLQIPVIDASILPEADGFIFGFPSRFGTLPAQVKALLDSTGGLWQQVRKRRRRRRRRDTSTASTYITDWGMCFGPLTQGKLLGKPVSVFFGSGTQGGGQETVALSFVPFAVHHGMIFVPPGK